MAGQTVGSLLIRLGVDIGGLTKGLNQAERSLMKFSGKMESIGRTLSTAITLPIIGAGAAALKAAADYEQLEVSFQTLLKSAEKGSKFFEDLKKFSAATPFEMTEVAAAAKVMLGYGFSADEANRQLQILGDVAAATGGDIEGLSVIMGQGAALGKFMTVDLKQLAMRGIPILDALSKQLGVSAGEVMELASTSQISYPMVAKAIEDMAKEGGPYFNAMQNQSKTLGGLFSTLKDTAIAAFADVGMSIKETFKLDEVIVKFTEKIQRATEWFKSLSDEQRKTIVIIAAVAAAIGPLLLGFATISKVVATAVMGFKGLLGAVSLLTSPVGLVVVAIAALAAGLVYAWNKSDAFREAVGRLGVILMEIGENVGRIWGALKERFSAAISAMWDVLKPFVMALGDVLKKIGSFALALIGKYLEGVAKIYGKIAEVIELINDKVDELANSKLGKVIAGAKELAVSAGESVAGAVVKPFQVLEKWMGLATEETQRFGHGARGLVEKVKPAAEEVDVLGEEIKGLGVNLENTTDKTEKLAKALSKVSAKDAGGFNFFPDTKGKDYQANFGLSGSNEMMDQATIRMKAFSQSVVNGMGKAEQAVRSFGSSMGSAFGEMFSKIQETFSGSEVGKWLEQFGPKIANGIDIAFQAIEALDGIIQQMFANKSAAIDADYAKQKAIIESSRMSEEQKQKAIQRLDAETDAKRKKLQRQQAIREKMLAIFSATINAAGAVVKALATDPTGVLAIIVGALSAIQIGMIAGAKIPALAKGGLAYGPQMAMVGDNPGARVDPEVIAPLSKLQSMLGGAGIQEVIVRGVISGRDLLLVQERASQDRLRTRGF